MYAYVQWLFVDRNKKQKFDSIANGHEAALIAMGIISESQRATQNQGAIECPLLFIPTMEKYRGLKFVQRETSDNITIYPRGMINWQDVTAYAAMTRQSISILESELIMGIDAIFESREDE